MAWSCDAIFPPDFLHWAKPLPIYPLNMRNVFDDPDRQSRER